MDIVIIDYKDIYSATVDDKANSDDVLAAYMQISGETRRSIMGEQYVYKATKYSPALYSIRREIEDGLKSDDKILHFDYAQYTIDIANWWAQVYPVLEIIATTTGALTGTAAVVYAPVAFIKWIRSKTSNREYMLVKVLEKDSWNISILSEFLSIGEDESKKLLKGFGYIWDSHKMLFVASKNTEKLRNIKPRRF